ncbi:MAG: hypothetical protein KGP06_00600 [Acidobacteria bacterium]|nr:hypothetical protein [Acidobacteriota bacterium]
MCSKVRCKSCGKATWSGCGQHVEEALRGIPENERCQGHVNEPAPPGFFSKLFGKK